MKKQYRSYYTKQRIDYEIAMSRKKNGDLDGAARLLNSLAIYYKEVGDLGWAEFLLEEKAKFRNAQEEAIIKKQDRIYYNKRYRDYWKAESLAKAGDLDGAAKLLNEQVIYYKKEGKLGWVKFLLEEKEKLTKRKIYSGIYLNRRRRHFEKAISLKKDGDLDGAAKHLKEQEIYYKKAGDLEWLGSLLREHAQLLEKTGNFKGAVKLLIKACNLPHINHNYGIYNDLFKMCRKANSEDIKNSQYKIVIDRVLNMLSYDDKMIAGELACQDKQDSRKRSKDYFDMERNFSISDAKVLLNAARYIKDKIHINKAKILIKKFIPQGLSITVLDKSLAKQCDELNIRLIRLNIPKIKTPLLSAYTYYLNHGYVGAYCGGEAILMIIRALTLDVLIKYYPLEDFYTRGVGVEGAKRLSLGGHFDFIKNPYRSGFGLKSDNPRKAQEEIYAAIQSIDKQIYLENFRELMDDSFNRQLCPGLSIEFASAFIDAINRSELENIAKKVMSSPFTSGLGWPALTLIKKGEIIFAEVITTDVLDASQLKTLSEIRVLINARFIVLRIN